ncbi:MAG: oligoendopeptidase [Thermodesulfobacteriota bacterium]|nr:oligoendopeptidase [Thermodesulfobacteriota bacterium]
MRSWAGFVPENLPKWSWQDFEPYYAELVGAHLHDMHDFLSKWTELSEAVDESFSRLHVAVTVNTQDEEAKNRYQTFLSDVYPNAEEQEQALKRRLLESGQEMPARFEIPFLHIKQEVELFRSENLPLLVEERLLENEYDKTIGAQTVNWNGEEITVTQLRPYFQDRNRATREEAWRAALARQMQDREAINELWVKFLSLRGTIAGNADFSDYRSYRWKQLMRLDYTPADCKEFHDAIRKTVVPAAARLYEKRRDALGVTTLRPWDLDVDPYGRPPLKPFREVSDLTSTCGAIFSQMDERLGAYFRRMEREHLLDLDNRKNKAPGGYCTDFPASRKPFIFMNAVGIHDDVQTLLHEAGHAFHTFERASLPYYQQQHTPMEFAEVASMAMELLAGDFLESESGGFYSREEALRARTEHLEKTILFWPYMAVVDAFQHWVYENPTEAQDPCACDGQWRDIWNSFMGWIDWSGLEDELATGWQRKLHIHTVPFYYVEYGLAQLGALQVWERSLTNRSGALDSYLSALSLGGTVSLPQLYATAGAVFTFSSSALAKAVSLAESAIERPEGIKNP